MAMAMGPLLKGAVLAVVVVLVVGTLAIMVFVKTTGLSARAKPGSVETAVTRRLRALAVPAEYERLKNPVLANRESIRNGMSHFADHCAVCHANNGSGDTEMGKGMFPPAPDMRRTATQNLSDGMLFYIIEHGVRFTGMPAWGTGTVEGEEASWHLVNFIRRLPKLTEVEEEEMAGMNPRPPAEIRQDIEEERFLRGDGPATQAPPSHAH
ncbi:MAG: c-type cytochrome [Vicinamibacterales bacterium]